MHPVRSVRFDTMRFDSEFKCNSNAIAEKPLNQLRPPLLIIGPSSSSFVASASRSLLMFTMMTAATTGRQAGRKAGNREGKQSPTQTICAWTKPRQTIIIIADQLWTLLEVAERERGREREIGAESGSYHKSVRRKNLHTMGRLETHSSIEECATRPTESESESESVAYSDSESDWLSTFDCLELRRWHSLAYTCKIL